jgi:hypothetical protein
MTRTFAVLMLLFLATAAAQAEEQRKAVFITQESIDVAARETVKHPPRTFQFDFGDVVYENRYGRARFAYLPFLRTLPYTFPAPNWNQIPNPFYLSGCTACAR